MPCSDAGMDEYYNREEYGVYTSSADIATQVACEALRHLANIDGESHIRWLSPLAQKWFKNHQKQDADRA